MTPFEKLVAIADDETLELARRMIGKQELALLIANAALKGTSKQLSPTDVAGVLQITPQGAGKKIDNTAVKQ
jgi:hypothetical protein